MKFFVNNHVPSPGEVTFLLVKDGWNDWFKWRTLYSLKAVMPDGERIDLGGVKIGKKGMGDSDASTELPAVFDSLDESYFSLGQDENYYETLLSLGDEISKQCLLSIRDCAYSPKIFEENEDEPVMQESLLRYVDASRVKERFHRLATGELALTAYSFEYHFPLDAEALTPPPVLDFYISPRSLPATNIHVLIGRNGVGKTRCFDLLARSFLGMPAEDQQQSVGKLRNKEQNPFVIDADEAPDFAGLVTVSFSAFDARGPLAGAGGVQKRYAYIGLVTHEPPVQSSTSQPLAHPRVKGAFELASEFSDSVLSCREGVRRGRWKNALNLLEADPLFAEANVSQLAEGPEAGVKDRAKSLFAKLSSGHAVVLLSITRLVELVEEKSLVLIDEPESHLHPPLLSAFVRALSKLLIDRNGVAIIATHSPVVLQEVPASCVWKLGRSGHEARADRPELETFGENVGVLTREVFGLEVTQTGFHRLISEMAEGSSYEGILYAFNGQLGAEARALARALSVLPQTQLSSDDTQG